MGAWTANDVCTIGIWDTCLELRTIVDFVSPVDVANGATRSVMMDKACVGNLYFNHVRLTSDKNKSYVL